MMGAVVLQPAPWKLEEAQNKIFSPEALQFMQDLCRQFDERVESLYAARARRAVSLRAGVLPSFRRSRERSDPTWRIAPLPHRLQCRRVDLGDVSASNTAHLLEAVNSDVQGVQVEFDDGHCPTWRNQVQAYHNVIELVNGRLAGAPQLVACPTLMLRPRAFNIIEHNIMCDGKEVPGPLVDLAVLMHHTSAKLYENSCGPYIYISKLEGADEAKLWDDILTWLEQKLHIPHGTMKACVLIENILSTFELEEILFALRDHSMGLNCGIWDYLASICAKLGHKREWMLPDRHKYVSTEAHMLREYLSLVVRTCHARGAPATGGMAAAILPPADSQKSKAVIASVLRAKLKEMEEGVDGFLVYDARLVPHVNQLWQKYTASPNQINCKLPNRAPPKASELLTVPAGGVTLNGVKHNVAISILFIYHWLSGVGHFFYNGFVEDSATAEISRWQIWQWIRFQAELEDGAGSVTVLRVNELAAAVAARAHRELCRSAAERKRLTAARYMALELFCLRDPPEFVTTYLNDNHKFRTLHNKALLAVKSSI